MRNRDGFDELCAGTAMAADALAVLCGFVAAFWIRFHSGWFAVTKGIPPLEPYALGAGLGLVLGFMLFHNLGLYRRPQVGSFAERVPRLVRATGWLMLLLFALAEGVRIQPPLSRGVVALALPCVFLALLLERWLLFHLEGRMAPRLGQVRRVVMLGDAETAARLGRALLREPRLRLRKDGFYFTDDEPEAGALPADQVRGGLAEFRARLETDPPDQVILTDSGLDRETLMDVMLQCSRNLVAFKMVPDMFRILTSRVEIVNVHGIPLLGVETMPLDALGNRILKRLEDVAGALAGLALALPVVVVFGPWIRRTSPGPVFFRQTRCGESGRPFTIYKLRTMRTDAEEETGPVWATPGDPRVIPIGRFLRRWNLDELPQFWNVLKGDMSLVGPRPERPHFVEQFKEEIGRYMWRHRFKPGLTGWAQVNGLRGQSDIHERLRYDLFYLENWSLGLDFKILLKTLASFDNAY